MEEEKSITQSIKNQNITNHNIPNRKQRRLAQKFQGLLKSKNKYSFLDRSELRINNIKSGKEVHEQNSNKTAESLLSIAEKREINQIKTWKEIGYNEKEIELLRESNALLLYTTKNDYRRDVKKARQLFNEAKESFKSRN